MTLIAIQAAILDAIKTIAAEIVRLREEGFLFREIDAYLGFEHADAESYSFSQKFWHTKYCKALTGR